MQDGLKNGTTCTVYFGVLDSGASKLLADVMIDEGQRGWASKVSMDRNAPSYYCEETNEGLEGVKQFCKYVVEKGEECDRLVRPALCPRFIPTCSADLMKGLSEVRGSYPGEEILVTSHVSESVDEVEFVKGLHPGEGTDAQIFDEYGLLRNSVQAHCVHCNRADWKLMSEKSASVAFCPLSNFYFAGGNLDADEATQGGVKVGLGTDVAGGYDGSILSAIRNAVISSRMRGGGVDWKTALGMATVGGAEAVGMGEELGKFKVGYRADFVWWEGQGGGGLGGGQEGEVEWIVHKGDDRNVRGVWVDGRQVL